MRGKNKIALAVELSICFRAESDKQYIHLYIPVLSCKSWFPGYIAIVRKHPRELNIFCVSTTAESRAVVMLLLIHY